MCPRQGAGSHAQVGLSRSLGWRGTIVGAIHLCCQDWRAIALPGVRCLFVKERATRRSLLGVGPAPLRSVLAECRTCRRPGPCVRARRAAVVSLIF